MSFNPLTVIIIMVLGVLFFGKNLPEVARQIGSALMEFRKGVDEWKELGSLKSGGHKPAGSGVGDVSRAGGGSPPVEELPEQYESLGAKFEPPQANV